MNKLIIGSGLLLLLASCGGGGKSSGDDTATSGTITVAADESLRPIMEAEQMVFESIYPSAHLHVVYTNESDAIAMVIKDSARIAIVTREMNADEKAMMERQRITPRYSPFAYDAVSIILNKNNTDTVYNLDQLRSLFNGTAQHWKDLNPKSGNEAIQVVFDSPKSGAIRHIRDSLLKGAELGKNCFAVNSNEAVIDYVEQHKNAIGIIGVNWISDRDDTLTHGFLGRIKVANLVPVNPETAEARTMKPYQAYISLKQYPLWRKVNILSREARVGLGTGFASFVASDRGQRIVLKSGLVPATAPIRIVQLNNK